MSGGAGCPSTLNQVTPNTNPKPEAVGDYVGWGRVPVYPKP